MQEKSTIIFNKFYSFIKHLEEKEDKRAKNSERLKREGWPGAKLMKLTKRQTIPLFIKVGCFALYNGRFAVSLQYYYINKEWHITTTPNTE